MCHLLALLGAHPILHVSRIRVKIRIGPVRTLYNFYSLFQLFSGLSQSKINSETLSFKALIIWRVAACQKFRPHGKT
jgi:hypothetical protein